METPYKGTLQTFAARFQDAARSNRLLGQEPGSHTERVRHLGDERVPDHRRQKVSDCWTAGSGLAIRSGFAL
jgi:hypothetical protein